MRLLPDWVDVLTLQQQAVLVLPLRGPDGFPKYHTVKEVLKLYRGCLVASASHGRHLRIDEGAGTLSSLAGFSDNRVWHTVLHRFKEITDELPLHYFTHLMHGAQVLGYHHPDVFVADRWREFYLVCCDYLHVPPESKEAMDSRLNDFGRNPTHVAP